MNTKTCSAFVGGPDVCRNGFPQNAACSGIGCPTCGNVKATPACMRDDMPDKVSAAWFDDAGRPKFAKVAATKQEQK